MKEKKSLTRQSVDFLQKFLVSPAWYFTAVITWILLFASVPGYYARFVLSPMNQHLSLSIVLVSTLGGLVSFLSAVISLGLAILLRVRKPGDWMAIFVSYFLLAYGVVMEGPLESLEYSLYGNSGQISFYAQFLITTPFLALVLVFPNGKIVPAWARWILYASFFYIPILPFLSYKEVYLLNTPRVQIMAFFIVILAFLAFFAQFYRYLKLYTPIERQQTKVVLYGFGLWIIFMTISSPLYYFILNSPDGRVKQSWQFIGGIPWQIGVGIIPVSLTIAIIRSHLWDIDVVIRRTLVYGALSLTLAAAYFGSIVLLQVLLHEITGQQQLPIATVLSTLLIAALFTPLRRRIQNDIDRRFFRQKYDAEKMLGSFAMIMRNEVDMDNLTDQLLVVIEDTFQPETLTIWLYHQPEKDDLARQRGSLPRDQGQPI